MDENVIETVSDPALNVTLRTSVGSVGGMLGDGEGERLQATVVQGRSAVPYYADDAFSDDAFETAVREARSERIDRASEGANASHQTLLPQLISSGHIAASQVASINQEATALHRMQSEVGYRPLNTSFDMKETITNLPPVPVVPQSVRSTPTAAPTEVSHRRHKRRRFRGVHLILAGVAALCVVLAAGAVGGGALCSEPCTAACCAEQFGVSEKKAATCAQKADRLVQQLTEAEETTAQLETKIAQLTSEKSVLQEQFSESSQPWFEDESNQLIIAIFFAFCIAISLFRGCKKPAASSSPPPSSLQSSTSSVEMKEDLTPIKEASLSPQRTLRPQFEPGDIVEYVEAASGFSASSPTTQRSMGEIARIMRVSTSGGTSIMYSVIPTNSKGERVYAGPLELPEDVLRRVVVVREEAPVVPVTPEKVYIDVVTEVVKPCLVCPEKEGKVGALEEKIAKMEAGFQAQVARSVRAAEEEHESFVRKRDDDDLQRTERLVALASREMEELLSRERRRRKDAEEEAARLATLVLNLESREQAESVVAHQIASNTAVSTARFLSALHGGSMAP